MQDETTATASEPSSPAPSPQPLWTDLSDDEMEVIIDRLVTMASEAIAAGIVGPLVGTPLRALGRSPLPPGSTKYRRSKTLPTLCLPMARRTFLSLRFNDNRRARHPPSPRQAPYPRGPR